MAIIKAVDHPGKSLAQIIRYVTRNDKTEPALISGWNIINPQQARQEMMATKRQWGKAGGRQYKHFVQSFRADDGITPAEAHRIAAELVEASPMFADYEVLIATHQDRNNVHTHMVCNSVSITDGHKFRYAKPELEELKLLSDQIVRAHGYRLEQERDETENVTSWDQNLYRQLESAHGEKKSSWMYDTAAAVIEAVEQAGDRAAFIHSMEAAGYSVRWGERTITITTPEGKRVRSSRLEEIFKLPSLMALYGDRTAQQELLRAELDRQHRSQKESAEHMGATDWSRFDLDLRTDAGNSTANRQDQQRYAAACAVCRQLRAADSMESFRQGMALGGYRVQYVPGAKNVIFTTPEGLHVRSSLMEKRYNLPSIKAAIEALDSRELEQPAIDGELWPELWQVYSSADGQATARVYGGRDAVNARKTASGRGRKVRVRGRRARESGMWQHELDAAAVALGQGMQQDGPLCSTLEEWGYDVELGTEFYLITPRRRRLRVIPDPQPQRGWVPFESVVLIGDATIGLLPRPKTPGAHLAAGVVATFALAAMMAALVIETVALLIRAGITVATRGKGKKLKYSVPAPDGTMTMRPESREAAAAMTKKAGSRDQASDQASSVQPAAAGPDLPRLRDAVQQAAQAETQTEFVRAMADQGYGVRWTRNGTITFILPDGQRVRSRRLEETYGLPSIAAAYGQERQAPTKGPRVIAAEAIRQALNRAPDLAAFDAAMKQSGYRIRWQPDLADAVITAPTGENMRLSSLKRTFRLPSVKERYGIQHQKTHTGRNSSSAGSGNLDAADRGARAAAAYCERAARTERSAEVGCRAEAQRSKEERRERSDSGGER